MLERPPSRRPPPRRARGPDPAAAAPLPAPRAAAPRPAAGGSAEGGGDAEVPRGRRWRGRRNGALAPAGIGARTGEAGRFGYRAGSAAPVFRLGLGRELGTERGSEPGRGGGTGKGTSD